MNKQENLSEMFLQKMAIKSLVLILLIASTAFIGVVSANSKTPTNTIQKYCPTILNVHFVAGSDSHIKPVAYPAATVKVASSYTSATAQFSLFPSTSNSSTYYTDLLRIKNLGTDCTINSITISNIVGASNLGNLTIYYYAVQTNSPQTGNPIASISLTANSSGTINLLSHAYQLAASTSTWVEIAGYAAPTAVSGSTISFTLTFQIAPAQPLAIAVNGAGSLLMIRSSGALSGDHGSQAFFRFNVKGADENVNGKLSLILRHTDAKGHMNVYQITGSAPFGLNVNKSATYSAASFNMTATIHDITHPCKITTIINHAQIQVTMTDYSNKPDTIAFTVTSQTGQLYFSSNWHNGVSVEQNLRSGTIQIG